MNGGVRGWEKKKIARNLGSSNTRKELGKRLYLGSKMRRTTKWMRNQRQRRRRKCSILSVSLLPGVSPCPSGRCWLDSEIGQEREQA